MNLCPHPLACLAWTVNWQNWHFKYLWDNYNDNNFFCSKTYFFCPKSNLFCHKPISFVTNPIFLSQILLLLSQIVSVYAIKSPFVDTEVTFHCGIDGRPSRQIWREKIERDGKAAMEWSNMEEKTIYEWTNTFMSDKEILFWWNHKFCMWKMKCEFHKYCLGIYTKRQSFEHCPKLRTPPNHSHSGLPKKIFKKLICPKWLNMQYIASFC